MNAGIILAAGRGSRMKNLTAHQPKCLLSLAGKPMLHWQIESLQKAGLERLLVVRGYASEQISGNFATVENPRWDQTNMLTSLLCAHDFVSSFFATSPGRLIVSYSDIVFHPDHVQALLECQVDIAITYDIAWESLWRLRFGDPLLDAETFRQEDGILREIGGKPRSMEDIHGQYMGLLSFSPAGWQSLMQICGKLDANVDKMDMTSFLRVLISKNIPIGAVPVTGKWCEADCARDIEAYEQELTAGKWLHDWRYN